MGDVDPLESAATSRIITYATVTATDAPAADGLQLTNEIVLQATNSQGELAQLVDTVQITVKEPVVDIYKGVVGYETIGLALGGVTFSAPNAASSFSGNGQCNRQGAGDRRVESHRKPSRRPGRGSLCHRAGKHRSLGRLRCVALKTRFPRDSSFRPAPSDMELTVRLGDGTTQLVQTTGYVVTSIDPVSRTFSIELTDQPGNRDRAR